MANIVTLADIRARRHRQNEGNSQYETAPMISDRSNIVTLADIRARRHRQNEGNSQYETAQAIRDMAADLRTFGDVAINGVNQINDRLNGMLERSETYEANSTKEAIKTIGLCILAFIGIVVCVYVCHHLFIACLVK